MKEFLDYRMQFGQRLSIFLNKLPITFYRFISLDISWTITTNIKFLHYSATQLLFWSVFFFYSYETANGISASEYGVYKPGLTNDEGIQSAAGSYSYTGPDNVVYTITYTAGVEGFVPQGAHIPTPPPVPEAIQKILQFSGESSKYGHQFEDLSASNKYTSALPTPYAGYNANYNRITSARGTEYKVLDESRK